MLDQHTLVVARHDKHTADYSVEDTEDICPFGRRERDARVVRQFQVFVNRMVVDTETLGDDTLPERPRQLAPILGELARERRVHLCVVLLLFLDRCLEDPLNLTVETVDFFLFGSQVIAVLLLAFGEPPHILLRLLLLLHQLAVFLFPGCLGDLRFRLDQREFFPLDLEFRLLFPHLSRLCADLSGQTLQERKTTVALPDVLTGQQVHEPDARVAVLVGVVDELVVVRLQRVELLLEPVDLPLLGGHLVVDDGNPLVQFMDQ